MTVGVSVVRWRFLSRFGTKRGSARVRLNVKIRRSRQPVKLTLSKTLAVTLAIATLAACGSSRAPTTQQSPSRMPTGSVGPSHALAGRFDIRCVGFANLNTMPPPVPAPQGAYIEFGPGSKVHGNDGANDWQGTSRGSGATLRIEKLSTTLVGSTDPMGAAFIALESGHPMTVKWTDGSPSTRSTATFVVDHFLLTTNSKAC